MATESESLFWKFAESTPVYAEGTTEKEQYAEFSERAKELLSPLQHDLLNYSLALRYFSPKVQLYRQYLATILETMEEGARNKASSCKSWVHANNQIYCTPAELPSTFTRYLFVLFVSIMNLFSFL